MRVKRSLIIVAASVGLVGGAVGCSGGSPTLADNGSGVAPVAPRDTTPFVPGPGTVH